MAINSHRVWALALVGVLATPASAMGTKPPSEETTQKQATKQTASGRALTWYDGAQPRTIWLDTALVAEFTGAGGASSTVKAALPSAKEHTAPAAGLRLWEVSDDAERAIAAIKRASPQARVSPVFRDGDGGGRMRALPGNVIVYLDPAWDRARAQEWAKSHGVEIVKQLEFGPNIYLIKTDPGLAALDTANRLRTVAGVVHSMPDWWASVAPR